MAFKQIKLPKGTKVKGKGFDVQITWNAGSAPRMNDVLSKMQETIDSEVLRRCSPYVPHKSGTLERSGQLGTVIGSGEVKYIAPYARYQYYCTSQTRPGAGNSRRGGMWFERMKTANKNQILRVAAKAAGTVETEGTDASNK